MKEVPEIQQSMCPQNIMVPVVARPTMRFLSFTRTLLETKIPRSMKKQPTWMALRCWSLNFVAVGACRMFLRQAASSWGINERGRLGWGGETPWRGSTWRLYYDILYRTLLYTANKNQWSQATPQSPKLYLSPEQA